MKEFKPIAMRCNQQQYDEIKQILIDNGCRCNLNGTFNDYPYLTNNYDWNKNNINNTINGLKDSYNRTSFETWNKDIFLEYCGIDIKEDFKVGDWVVITEIDAKKLGYTTPGNNSNKYNIGDVVQLTENKGNWSGSNCKNFRWWFTSKDDRHGIVSALFRKATLNEIHNEFTSVYLKCISSTEYDNFTPGKIYFVNDLTFISNRGFRYNKVKSINDFFPKYFTWELSTKEAYDAQEGKSNYSNPSYYPEVGDWVFTDMCNVKGSISRETCVKVTQVDKIPDEQPNFLVETESGDRFWCYPSKNNTSFVRKAEPHEIPNNNIIPEYVECIKEWLGSEFKKSIIGKIYDTKVKSDFSMHDWNKMSNFNNYFKPSTKKAFDAQNARKPKNDFIVGKWYKVIDSDVLSYKKFFKLDDNKFYYSEEIYQYLHAITHSFKNDWIGKWFGFTLLTDLSEIQKYLPDGHVDKISKEPDLHDLLKYAKKHYPIGTQFSPAHVLSGINVVTAEDYHWENDRKDCIVVTSKSLKETWSGCLYKDGKWAAIIENVKPVETKSIYLIAAEKAMERFKDIQIGDEYMTISGYKQPATRLPEIIGDDIYCYIDCGPGYLWKYDKPDEFGYKLVSQSRPQHPLTPKDAIVFNPNPLLSLQGIGYESPSLFAALDYKSSLKEIQPTESITNQLLNIKLNNY